MNAALTVVGMLAAVAILNVLLQKYSPGYALLLSLAAALCLLLRLGAVMQSVVQGVALLGQRTDGQAFSCLVRSAGILLVTDYARTLCEEAGADSLGWCAGLAGRCLVLAAAFPLLEDVCRRLWGLAG